VLTGALCTRVLVHGGRATGVEYWRGGRLHRIGAGREVILSAGTFGSPQILELSGIGDPEHLRGLGIDVVAESPHVGRHLQDHPVVGVIHRSNVGGTLDDAETYRELARWLASRRGRLTSNVAEAGGFIKSSSGTVEPDLQLHFGPVFFADHGLTPFDGRALSMGPLLLGPVSRGSVHTRSVDPLEAPRIQGNYLSDPTEVETLVTGLELTREIMSARAFDEVRGEEILPGSSVTSRHGLARFVRERVELLYHPVGTCRIGREGEGVVDPHLEVRGIGALRVADASVMPRIVSGNTNAATLMIGARAVEMILGQESKGSES
jgi:choline dehydrogenase